MGHQRYVHRKIGHQHRSFTHAGVGGGSTCHQHAKHVTNTLVTDIVISMSKWKYTCIYLKRMMINYIYQESVCLVISFNEIVRTFNIFELESFHLYRFAIGSDVRLLRSDPKWSSDAEYNETVLRLHKDNAYLLDDFDFCISSKGTSLKIFKT